MGIRDSQHMGSYFSRPHWVKKRQQKEKVKHESKQDKNIEDHSTTTLNLPLPKL